ncbi:MAG TPA: ABC transporter permease [Thermoleophilaceae bacterium]|nr:ABC transporter permease [Thermoleophilaceae bacterium]
MRLLEHLWYSIVGIVLGAGIGLPLGLLTGHTGRGSFAAAALSNYWRALPTLGVVVLVFRLAPLSVWPVLAALVAIAVPPILLNTDAGLRSVDEAVRDAAAGMGLTSSQRLWRVEVPVALPLIVTGLRSASAQVIATTSVAAFVGLGGLGRYIIDGYASRDLAQITAGAVLIAATALLVDGCFALAQRRLTSRPRARAPVHFGRLPALTGSTRPRKETSS